MTKGQTIRAAFAYFHTVDSNAVAKLRSDASEKRDPPPSADAIRAAARKALEAKAAQLTKSIDQLTAADRIDTSEVKMKKFMGHFGGTGVGFVLSRIGKDGPEADAVWRKLQEPKLYFTTLLVIYPTTRTGEIDKARLADGWDVIPWRFSTGMYEKIWKLNAGLRENGMSICSQDLKLECKDAQYQNIDMSFVGPVTWQKNPKFREMVLARAMPMYDKLISFRDMSTDQLRQKLGLGSSVSAVSVGSDASAGSDFSDLLDQVLSSNGCGVGGGSVRDLPVLAPLTL